MTKNVDIKLKSGKERSLERKHPWVFSGAIQHISGEPENGELVRVFSSSGKILGKGHFQHGSISVRMITFEDNDINQDFWNNKLSEAWELRKRLGLTDSVTTNVFRLIHGEGDGLPGLIIDYYNGVFVIQCHSTGMYLNRHFISQALLYIKSDTKAIYDKSAETLPKDPSHPIQNEYLFGNHAGEEEVTEHGNRFLVNWISGQKTGFFIDQRENRALLASYARDKKILNTFCYSGGFSVYALNNGAKTVHSLDSSAKAIELVEKNVALIHAEDRHQSICSDAVPYLKNMDHDYDIIILDPPAYAKHLSAKHNAIQGYRRLNEEAIRHIKSGGLLFTFSCSQAIDMNLFTGAVFSAAVNTGRNVRILHRLHQPADHPISMYHPEGEYLKGLVLSVI